MKFKVVFISQYVTANGPETNELEDLMNNGWTPITCDATAGNFIYILEKEEEEDSE